MNYSLEELNKMMVNNNGSLDLMYTAITVLPDNLTVGGSLSLSGISITELPDNLTVGGSLNLSGTAITVLPDNLSVGGSLSLSSTKITTLPDNLTVGGSLYLHNTPITVLPENLTVGGDLDLSYTKITALPDNLTVGGSLFLRGTAITNPKHYKQLKQGEYVEGNYLYADRILTHVKRTKKIKEYTYYVGKIKSKNVIFDGTNYAHCSSLKSGIADLEFKKAKDRGAEQYKSLTPDSVLTLAEAITAYRVITGACKQGTEDFVNSLGKNVQEKYTVRQMIEVTNGRYGYDIFERFFKE